MAVATMTITGKAGPAQSVTAQVFQNVESYTVDLTNSEITLYQSGKATTIALGATLTWTTTVSAGSQIVSIS